MYWLKKRGTVLYKTKRAGAQAPLGPYVCMCLLFGENNGILTDVITWRNNLLPGKQR